jgi:hypothetical protein
MDIEDAQSTDILDDVIVVVHEVSSCDLNVEREQADLSRPTFMEIVKRVQSITGTSEGRAVETVRYVMSELDKAS